MRISRCSLIKEINNRLDLLEKEIYCGKLKPKESSNKVDEINIFMNKQAEKGFNRILQRETEMKEKTSIGFKKVICEKIKEVFQTTNYQTANEKLLTGWSLISTYKNNHGLNYVLVKC